jgi:hypothetical protein
MSFMPHHYDCNSSDLSTTVHVARWNAGIHQPRIMPAEMIAFPAPHPSPFCARMHRTKIHQTEAAVESTSCLLAGHSMTERRES